MPYGSIPRIAAFFLERDFGLTYVFITYDLSVATHIAEEIASYIWDA